jgi:hypothetical protein
LGLVDNPSWLLTGASFRMMELFAKTDGAAWTPTSILMQADLRAGLHAGRWRAAASLGMLQNGNSPAALAGNVVAREYWLGPTFADDAFLVRLGRINIPFGVRSIEHTLFVRSATRTDLNDTQQHGLSLAWRGASVRTEVLVIAGNLGARPLGFWEEGYAGYVEWSPVPQVALGLSSLVTYVLEDAYFRTSNTRQAHGVTLRAAPLERLVVLAEADYLHQAPSGLSSWQGLATMLQADFEPWQGLHGIVTGETYASGQPGTTTSWGAWAGVGWFLFSRVDVRADYMHRALSYGHVRVPVDAVMFQLHLFL